VIWQDDPLGRSVPVQLSLPFGTENACGLPVCPASETEIEIDLVELLWTVTVPRPLDAWTATGPKRTALGVTDRPEDDALLARAVPTSWADANLRGPTATPRSITASATQSVGARAVLQTF
jgi:hypothetical protein